MKPWSGKDFEYLGLYVKNNKKIGYFEVFDKTAIFFSDIIIVLTLL